MNKTVSKLEQWLNRISIAGLVASPIAIDYMTYFINMGNHESARVAGILGIASVIPAMIQLPRSWYREVFSNYSANGH